MVFNKRHLENAFSPNKVRKFGRAISTPNSGKAVTSRMRDRTRNEGGCATSIRVIVRVRPPNEKERQDNYRSIIKILDNKSLVFDPKEEESPFFYQGIAQKGRDLLKKQNKELEFVFDRVFDDVCTNSQVFLETTKEVIASLLEGYNSSVFAYGATGAGKTHTMLGNEGDPGITFKTIAELFSQIAIHGEHKDFNLGVTYLEVYNENVCDLLHKSGPLAIRDDGHYGTVVAGLKIISIKSPDELFTLLARGNKNRTQHPTDANQESSRSHAVFQVYITITDKLNGQKKHVKLSMIDLAGSERASATGCKGARFKEGANINKSLLALGNCINNLADGIKHIPYRDSKLTRLLKDSLGGNCLTVMIANIGPSSLTFEDTYNTLRYANRAKKIKLNIKKNITSVEMHATDYMKIVEEQTKEIAMLKEQLLALTKESAGTKVESGEKARSIDAEKELIELSDKMLELIRAKAQLNEKLLSLQSTDKILCCRIQYKIAAEKRLHNLTTAVSVMCREEQNVSGKSRVNKSLLYFKRQREVVKIQMQAVWNDLIAVEMQIEGLNASLRSKNLSDEVRQKCELSLCQIEIIRSQQQYEHAKKVSSLQQCEIQSIDTIVRSMSTTLQTYYKIMQGSGFMTESMKQEFKQLVKSLEGVRNIKWADSAESDNKYCPEDSYVLTCLSTKELDDPLNSEMPIYHASYLEDATTEQTKESLNGTIFNDETSDGMPSRDPELHFTPVQQPPSTLNTITKLDQEQSLLSIDDANNENNNETVTISESNSLNNTFTLTEIKTAKKRTLIDKNQTHESSLAKQIKKISPKSRVVQNTAVSTGKENKNSLPISNKKSVMSAKSIAILNKLKADRLKPLPEMSNSSNDSPTERSTSNKVARIKDNRGVVRTHPHHKDAVKQK